MTTYNLGPNDVGAWEKALAANVEDTVTFDFTPGTDRVPYRLVRVVNVSGAAPIYFTVNGTAPAVGAASTFWLPAVAGAMRDVSLAPAAPGTDPAARWDATVRLVSSGATTYSVEGER